MRRSIALVFVSAVVLFAVSHARPVDAADAAPGAAASPFEGKLVLAWLGSETDFAYLADARVEALGGRSFLMGKRMDTSGKPLSGVTMWVPVEKISRLDVFDNFETYERLKQQQQVQPKK